MSVDVSVVMATYNRKLLLSRSLACYERQNFPLDRMEIIVIDDWSDDETDAHLRHWSDLLPITVIRPPYKQPGTWRDCAATINIGLRAAKGKFVIATHPEVMPGPNTIGAMWDSVHRTPPGTYFSAKIYYLTQGQQGMLERAGMSLWDYDPTIPDGLRRWNSDAPGAVRTIPGFYDVEPGSHPDYTHAAMDRHTTWGSWVFGGMTRKTWRDVGGFTEFTSWGSVDVDWLNRRNALGMPTQTLMAEDTFCVHQNHDLPGNTLTDRNMEKAMAPLPTYPNAASAIRENL